MSLVASSRFLQQNHKKGVFFDGYDRDNIVQHSSEFLERLEELDSKTIIPGRPLPQLQHAEKLLLRVVHDDSTFYANADQSQFWSDGEQQLLRQKSLWYSFRLYN